MRPCHVVFFLIYTNHFGIFSESNGILRRRRNGHTDAIFRGSGCDHTNSEARLALTRVTPFSRISSTLIWRWKIQSNKQKKKDAPNRICDNKPKLHLTE